MKLRSCYIENFGKLHEYKHDFTDGLNVILEENGWGKSTFAAFIKAMFYGMDYTTKKSITENERNKYMPWQGGRYGGYIVFETGDKVYRIERFFGKKDKDDTYKLYNEITGAQCNDLGDRPGEELFGIDAFGFERSTYIAQQGKEPAMNDSMTAKLNSRQNNGEVENYQSAVALIDDRLRFYKKTGDRGRIAEIETRLHEIDRELDALMNRTESVEELKARKAELENLRIEYFNKLKKLKEDIKKASEYDGLKAKKSHYDSLVKNYLDTKSKLDAATLFFEKPELIKDISSKKDDYDSLEIWDQKYKDESENIKELEYRKDGLTAQYQLHKKTPVLNIVLMLLGILSAGCGVFVWVMTELSVYIPVGCAVLGLVLFVTGIVHWFVGSSRVKKDYDLKIEEYDERLDCAKISLREYTVKKEQITKELENYIKCFQIEQSGSILRALTEIDGKIKEFKQLAEINEKAKKQLDEFESNNEMDKIRGLVKPQYDLSELQKSESKVNTELMSIMEEKNAIVRRMDSLINSDEDENDLMQEKENLTEELRECTKNYEILSLTKEYLATANERYKTKYIQNMKDAFAEYVGMINGHLMDNVTVDIDLNVMIEDYGAKRGAEYYSTGYRDMFSLCTRFALISAMFQEEKPFVILDDPFCNLDHEHMGNAMEFLTKLGKKHQLLYFTCHESRCL